MEKILITGGAGFIGSNLAYRLLKKGFQVLALDNYATGLPQNLPTHPALTVIEGTVADGNIVSQCFEQFQPTIVVHAAASYKDPDDWQEDVNSNITGTINMIMGAQNYNVKKFIYTQTALCYGRPLESPISLSHPLNPKSSYAITKTSGEYFLKESGLHYYSLRLANVYGPGHLSGPIPTFYKRLQDQKNCFVVDTRRDFIELEDFLVLIDKILEGEGVPGCYNVSSGNDYSIKDIYDEVLQHFNIDKEEPVELRPPGDDDVGTLLLDPSHTEKTFNWRASTGLREGLTKLFSWYDEYGVAQTYTHLKIGK